MARFASQTSVPVHQSRAEIEGILRRYGADGFRSGWQDRPTGRVEQIDFTVNGRLVRFTLIMPLKTDAEFIWTAHKNKYQRKKRSESGQAAAWEQACRQRWRALALCIKAKLEAVECKISEFESEFLAFIVDPNTGRTISEIVRPQISAAYEEGGRIGLPGLPAPEDFSDEPIETTTES